MSQIETGRQRDPKESWLEESHRSFYTYRGVDTEKSLHKANPCKLQHSLPFLNRFFALMNAKNAAMLSPVLCILPQERMLQIEIGRQRDPKESWREGGVAEKLLHIQRRLRREVFTQSIQKLLHKDVFTQRAFYTQTRLHTEVSRQRSLHTEELLHTKAFTHSKLLHTQGLLHREVLTQRSFLHTEGFTQRSVYSASCPFKKEPDHFLSLCSNTCTRIERATPV